MPNAYFTTAPLNVHEQIGNSGDARQTDQWIKAGEAIYVPSEPKDSLVVLNVNNKKTLFLPVQIINTANPELIPGSSYLVEADKCLKSLIRPTRQDTMDKD